MNCVMKTAPKPDAIDYYNDLLANARLESAREILAQATERRKLAFGDRPVCSVLRPFFIEEERYEYVKRAATLVMRGIASLSRRLFADEQLRKEMDLTAEEEELVQIACRYGAPDVSGRLDGFLSEEGEFNFVEYNAESPGGLAYGEALSDAFSSMPIMKDFARRFDFRALPIRTFAFDALAGAYRRWGGEGLPNIAIVDWEGVSTFSEFLLMQEAFESRGCRVKIADPGELEYHGEKLYAGDFPIDLVYKRVVLAELMAKFGLKHPLIEAARDGSVCVANGFGVHMLNKKAIFAFLSDPAYVDMFEPEVCRALARHIPWTRRVRERKTTYRNDTIDLIPFISENRERLVLKPSGEYGGKGVMLGWECGDAQWGEALGDALAGSYIAQERVPVGREAYPSMVDGELRFDERNFDLAPYVWDGERIEGCGVRLSSVPLINVTAGGGSATPMFIVSDA